MRLLVTGGAGFIGSNFVRSTLAEYPDARITVLDAFTYAAVPGSLGGLPAADERRLTVVPGSVADEDRVASCVADADAVVHFAAESHNDRSLTDPDAFVRTNVLGTCVVARACATAGVRLHHISTDEVFGDLHPDDPPFTTATPYAPSSPYSASKAAADHFVRAFGRSLDLGFTISNCSNNYGPYQHPEKFIPRQILSIETGQKPKLYGTGAEVRDWIHVDDHVRAIWAILERGTLGETYLVGADGELTNADVLTTLLRVTGYPEDWLVRVHDRPGHDRRYAIDASSTTALGWVPKHRDFREGLAETVDWYRAHRAWWEDAFAASEKAYAGTHASTPLDDADA